MDIYQIGEALFQRQLAAKQQTDLGAWLSLSPTDSVLSSLLDAGFENEDGRIHRHQHRAATLLYAFAGTTTVMIAGQRIVLTSGNLLFVAPQQVYQVLPLTAGDILTTVLLPLGSDLSTLLPKATDEGLIAQITAIRHGYQRWHYAQFNNTKVEDPAYIVERIICEIMTPAAFATKRVTEFLKLLPIELLRLNNYLAPQIQCSKRQVTTAELLHYIDRDYDVCTLKTMAQAFHYNPNYLSNRLKSATGQSFIQLVDERRMQAAQTLLANPQVTIDEIVMYIGYSSKSFFYKKFKARYGESPAQQRQRLLQSVTC